MGTAQFKFEPDYAVAPGSTLKEILEEKGISQSALAMRAGMTEKNVSQIINGVAPISYETAEKLEMALGVPANFWNQRELAYREAIVRVTAIERMKADIKWLKEIPVEVLKQLNRIDADANGERLVRSALKFFGVSSVNAWRETWENSVAQFRRGTAGDQRPGYVAAWLRIGDVQTETLETAPFNPDKFKRALMDARQMTSLPASSWIRALPERCAEAGVAVVFTHEIPFAAVSGATRWKQDKALIQLSREFHSSDQFWFTFFHEAGHILLHGKRKSFVESVTTNDTEEERQANEFARDMLIPPEQAKSITELKSRAQVTAFAKSIGVSPGIVVGRLQRELKNTTLFNDLKSKLKWSKEAV